MADSNHEWSVGGPLPQLRPHSRTKHQMLAAYLTAYVDVLTSNPRIPEFKLTLVDGFAGGGAYVDSLTGEFRFGSPLLMLQTMREAAIVAQAKRTNDFRLDVEYVFIEKSRDAFECLKKTLGTSDFRDLNANQIRLYNSTFVHELEKIIERVEARGRGNRALFILDQLGIKDVPFQAMRTIFSRLDNAEIILTFATDSLIDYLSETDTTQKILTNVGLTITKDEIQRAKRQADWRFMIQALLHGEFRTKSGAKYYTPFFIRSKDSHRDYWLIHLSRHAKARDVMATLHWKFQNNFCHYGRSGFNMVGYDPDQDVSVTRQRMLPIFEFDEAARESTQATLVEELSQLLYYHKGGIQFGKLVESVANETPANNELLNAALGKLNEAGMIVIRDETASERRRSGARKASDFIVPASQKLLFLPGQ